MLTCFSIPFSQIAEAGASSSAHAEDEKVGRGLPLMGSAIQPSIAPNVNLESGSCFDLPWVSTIGVGPNGRTVAGVTYRFGRNELNSTPSVLENKSS